MKIAWFNEEGHLFDTVGGDLPKIGDEVYSYDYRGKGGGIRKHYMVKSAYHRLSVGTFGIDWVDKLKSTSGEDRFDELADFVADQTGGRMIGLPKFPGGPVDYASHEGEVSLILKKESEM